MKFCLVENFNVTLKFVNKSLTRKTISVSSLINIPTQDKKLVASRILKIQTVNAINCTFLCVPVA